MHTFILCKYCFDLLLFIIRGITVNFQDALDEITVIITVFLFL